MTVIAPNRSESIIENGRPTTRLARFFESIAEQVNLINPDGSASLDHNDLANIGSNSHAQIDQAISDLTAHTGTTGIHFSDAPADSQDYVRNNNAWIVSTGGSGFSFDLEI
jgi:hypothetical protein